MKSLQTLFFLSLIYLSFQEIVHPVPPEAYYSFEEYCVYFGYHVQRHQIITQDHYNLTFFRVQKQDFKQNNLPVVYLQHGLLDSSDTFIVNYQVNAPAFVLADQGYDVWLGNTRGNKYSKYNEVIEQQEFWDFSFPEMISYDLPAGFQYIRDLTKQNKIDYIGHSQGTLIMFAALSEEQPIIKTLLGKFIALAPVYSIRNQKSELIKSTRKIADLSNIFYALGRTYANKGVYQVLELTNSTSHATIITCNLVPSICEFGLKQISDLRPELDHPERLSVVMGHYTAGASLRNLEHFSQMIDEESFCLKKLDYGFIKNLQKYGRFQPPEYDVSKIQADMYLVQKTIKNISHIRQMSGKYDLLADPLDVQELVQNLQPQNPNLFVKEYEAGHATFCWGDNKAILDDIIAILGKQ